MQPGKTSLWKMLLLLSCLGTILLIGCRGADMSGTNRTRAGSDRQVYRYGDVATDISSFDPGQATDISSLEAITMVFTGLVQMNDALQVQPQLAKSYAIAPDGLTYTFHLRTDLKFSDGTPLDASDVAYSIDRALSPQVASLNGVTLTYLGLIKGAAERVNGKIKSLIGDGIKIVDNNTIQLIVSHKTAYFLEALTYPTSYVVERRVIERWGNGWTEHLSDNGGQGGNGPFKVQNYNHNTGITFVPNSYYYGPRPQLRRVDFTFFKTAQGAFQAYQAGQVDFVRAVPPEILPVARTMPAHQYKQTPQLTIDYVALNYLYKPFDNIHIRQAFALAINKDIIANRIFNGSRIPTCHIVPAGMPGYNRALQCPEGVGTKGDANKARALFEQGLREEGLTRATFPLLTISYQSNASALDSEITTLRQQWQRIFGISVSAQNMDFVQLLSEENKTLCTESDLSRCLNQGLQMWAAAWGADYPDPQDWLTLQFGKGAPNNQWNYGQNLSSAAPAQQKLQDQLLQADVEQNTSLRMASYNLAEQQLVNDVAWLPLDQRRSSAVLKPYVIGQVFNVLGLIPPNDWAKIYIAVH